MREGRTRRHVFGTHLASVHSLLFNQDTVLDGMFEITFDSTAKLHQSSSGRYCAQLVLDGAEARAFTRSGFDWSTPYRPLLDAALKLGARMAVIEGEVVLQDRDGHEDFHGIRSALHRTPERLVMFAFDLLHLDGHYLRARTVEHRRALLRNMLACADGPIAFSDSVDGAAFLPSPRGRARNHRQQAPRQPLPEQTEAGHYHAGSAFVTLAAADRDRFWRYVENHAADQPVVECVPQSGATWVRPGLAVAVRHSRGKDMLRHATVTELVTP
jgi:bifunctional non-homologous end joining protein LigD